MLDCTYCSGCRQKNKYYRPLIRHRIDWFFMETNKHQCSWNLDALKHWCQIVRIILIIFRGLLLAFCAIYCLVFLTKHYIVIQGINNTSNLMTVFFPQKNLDAEPRRRVVIRFCREQGKKGPDSRAQNFCQKWGKEGRLQKGRSLPVTQWRVQGGGVPNRPRSP